MSPRHAIALLLLTAVSALPVNAQSNRTIRLNGSANTGVLEDNGNPNDNIIQLRSTNNSFSTVRFQQPANRLTLQTLGGNDNIRVEVDLDCTLVVNGGSGNDVFEIGTGQSVAAIDGNVTMNDRNGDNTLRLNAVTINGNLTVNDGIGFQTIDALLSTVRGNFRVNSPDGGSEISFLSFAQITGNVIVNNLGYGNDFFDLTRISVGGDCTLNFGNGDLDLSSFQATVRSLSTSVGSGVTDIFLGELWSTNDVRLMCAEGSTKLRALSNLITGQLLVKSGLGFDEVLVGGLLPRATGQSVDVNIETGDGGSDITIDSRGTDISPPRTIIDDVIIRTGSGSDLLTVTLANIRNEIGLVSYETGSGNSSILVEDLSSQPAPQIGDIRVLHQGGGFDNLSIDSASIERDVLVSSSWGGSDININDALIGGKADLTSRGGRDEVTISNTLFGDFNLSTGNGNSFVTITDSIFLDQFVSTGGRNFDRLTLDGNTFNGLVYTEAYEVVVAD